MRISRAEMIWEAIVAYATPSTPISKPSTNNRSNTVLSSAEITRNTSGLRESPTARRMPLPML